MFVVGVIRRFLKKRKLKSLRRYYSSEPSSVLTAAFDMRLDCPDAGKKYLSVKGNCIVSGKFIFESARGRVSVGEHTYIGASTFISRSSITIGDNVTIAWGCTVYDHDSHSLDYRLRRKDIDEDDAWIGMNCIILKGVTVGRGAVLGAGSVVTKDVPPWTLVAGNPAKVIKELPH